jgi:hypothetical protein
MKTTRDILQMVLITAIAAGWLVASTVVAGDAGPTPNKAAISDGQKSQLQEIFSRYEGTLGPLMKRYATEKAALTQSIVADKFDEAAIRAQFVKAAQIGAEITVANAKLRHEMRAILTKDQIDGIKKVGGEIAEANIDEMLFRLAAPVKAK